MSPIAEDAQCVGLQFAVACRESTPLQRQLEAFSAFAQIKLPGPMDTKPALHSDPEIVSSDTQLFKADLLTFWFSHFGPYFVMAPKG